MLILGLLGMYFYAAVVFVAKSLLLFRLAVAILCGHTVYWALAVTNDSHNVDSLSELSRPTQLFSVNCLNHSRLQNN